MIITNLRDNTYNITKYPTGPVAGMVMNNDKTKSLIEAASSIMLELLLPPVLAVSHANWKHNPRVDRDLKQGQQRANWGCGI